MLYFNNKKYYKKKEVLIINKNYKNAKNEYTTEGSITKISLMKKDGTELIATIDSEDIERVQNMGTWFAEWHKDFNNYLVQNISKTIVNGLSKDAKKSLQSVVLNTNTKAPIRHRNGDTLDNRKSNLEIVQRNTKNDYKINEQDDAAIMLRDKYGKVQAEALISKEDLESVVNDQYSWVYYRNNGKICVVANTPEGRVYLDKLIMKPEENKEVHHINLNPVDNRRSNLEIK